VKVRYGSYSCKQTRREHTCSTLIGDRLRPIGLGAAYSETGKRGSEAGRVPRGTDLCHFTALSPCCSTSAKRLHASIHDTHDPFANAVVRSAMPASLSA